MALLTDHISHIQNILNSGLPSDDNRYKERHIYYIFKYIRSSLIEDRANKTYFINPDNYQTIDCLQLTEGTTSECCVNIPSNYYIRKSVCEIPKILQYSRRLLIQGIRTLVNDSISLTSIDKINYHKYSLTKQDKLQGFFHKKHLFVVGTDMLESISLSAIFADPLDLAVLRGCCCDESAICFDPKTEDFPIDDDLVRVMNAMTIQELLKVANIVKEDLENEAKDSQLTQPN